MANVDGSKGPVCNNCGGYGFTNNLAGGSSGCASCLQTGIALPDFWEMQRRIEELEKQIEKCQQ